VIHDLARRLAEVYAAHPLNADAVLERVRRERGSLESITALDLSESSHGGATDQNHVGGAAAVRALAAAVGVERSWTVLDIGTGLGGTPRLLAHEYGCRCHGVELTASRFRDAVRLTRAVGLSDRVTFTYGDFMTMDVPGGPFDLAIGQGSFMHFPDTAALLRRVTSQLRPGGRLAIEDGVIVRPPTIPADRDALAELLRCWNGSFQQRDAWPALLAAAGLRLDDVEDLTLTAVHDFDALLVAASNGELAGVSGEEHRGWELGSRLSRSGHLGTIRLTATRPE
jgi:SAM-dependent methyltransferase